MDVRDHARPQQTSHAGHSGAIGCRLRVMGDRRAAPDLDARFAVNFHRSAIRGGAAGSTCDQRYWLGAAVPRRGGLFHPWQWFWCRTVHGHIVCSRGCVLTATRPNPGPIRIRPRMLKIGAIDRCRQSVHSRATNNCLTCLHFRSVHADSDIGRGSARRGPRSWNRRRWIESRTHSRDFLPSAASCSRDCEWTRLD
jgi:hypothetical protein